MGKETGTKGQVQGHISRRWLKWGRGMVVGVLVIGLGLLGWTLWTLQGRYSNLVYSRASMSDMPARSVAVVFGAGVWPNGALSLILRERLDAAIELYEAGLVQKLLFSGDNRVEDYNEPASMLAYALEAGVPREDIVLDYAGRRTYDTCYRARDIFQVSRVALITQRYHLPRALATCQGLGLESVGYQADRYEHKGYYLLFYRLREVPALWRAWWDLYVARPEPVLGSPLPIFGVQQDLGEEGIS